MSVGLTELTCRNAETLLHEMKRQVDDRDKRIKRLEELNSQLAARIDELEAEKKK